MSEPPLDLESLTSLYGEESVRELIEMSVVESDKLLEKIDAGITNCDAQAVSHDAHQLKGLASTMTMRAVYALARQLESKVKEGDWRDTPELFALLKQAIAELKHYVKPVLSK